MIHISGNPTVHALTFRAVVAACVSLHCLSTCLGQEAATERPQGPYEYRSEDGTVSVNLPDTSWKLTDQGQGAAKVLVFSPQADLIPRCSVLVLPKLFIPEGFVTRESQVKQILGEKYERESLEDVQFCDRKAQCWVYGVRNTKTVEWGFFEGESFVVLQLAATRGDWDNIDIRAQLDAIRDSFQYRGSAKPVTGRQVDRSSPAQVRQRRRAIAAAAANRSFAVVHHNILAKIDPLSHSLAVTDELTVRSLSDKLDSFSLNTSVVKIDDVQGTGVKSWSAKQLTSGSSASTSELTVELDPPLPSQQDLILTVATSSPDFFSAVDQKLVAEVAVLGQVREKSSYSSHVMYYPIDDVNDASVDLALTVPDGYQALTGGELKSQSSREGWTTFAYGNTDRRKRLLPFGFAVGKYVSVSGTSEAGLRLSIHGYIGEQKLLQQRLDVAIEAANLLENMMGPLPWKDVRFAHVTPERKETGVSLPGLIVISDAFFDDIAGVDLSDGDLNRRDALDLLIVPDELSHQWNVYAAPMSNQLGEGISTFTNILFVERRHGAAAYRQGIEFCRRAYLQSTLLDKDVAIADPKVYETTAYRGIAFCKTPVILAMLRDALGDESFFRCWRQTFTKFDPNQDGFEILEQALKDVTGEDWSWFMDQWFFQAGFPRVHLDYRQDGSKLHVQVVQVQDNSPARLKGMLRVRGTAAEEFLEQTVELAGKQTVLDVDCPFSVSKVEFDPEHRLLVEAVVDSKP